MCTNYNELWHRVITTSPWSWVAYREPFNDLSRATKHLTLSLAIPMLDIESRRFWLFFRTGYIRLTAWLGINRNDWLCTLSYRHQLLLTISLIFREPFFSFAIRGLKSILTVTFPNKLSEIKLLSTKLAHASYEESLSCRFCITKQFAFSTKTREMHRKLHLSGEIRAERKRDIDRWRIYRNENISRQKVSDELRMFNSADEIKKYETWTNSLWVGKAKTELKIKKKNFPNAAKFLFYNLKAIFFRRRGAHWMLEVASLVW